MSAPAYLDYAASAPLDPRVAAGVNQCLMHEELFGNPASAHHYGRLASARVETARTERLRARIQASRFVRAQHDRPSRAARWMG